MVQPYLMFSPVVISVSLPLIRIKAFIVPMPFSAENVMGNFSCLNVTVTVVSAVIFTLVVLLPSIPVSFSNFSPLIIHLSIIKPASGSAVNSNIFDKSLYCYDLSKNIASKNIFHFS